MNNTDNPTDTTEALVGPGHFQWNAGAWFGSTLGSTMYLLASAGYLVSTHPWLAAFVFAAWAGVWWLAIALWKERRQRLPYPSIQRLLLALAVIPAVVLSVFWWAAPELVRTWKIGGTMAIALFLIFPGLFALFAFLEKSALPQPEQPSKTVPPRP